MTKLSRTDLAAIYRACERLEEGINTMSCVALWDVCKDMDTPIADKYAVFYNKKYSQDWGFSTGYETGKNERILALLFFAAAGGEI